MLLDGRAQRSWRSLDAPLGAIGAPAGPARLSDGARDELGVVYDDGACLVGQVQWSRGARTQAVLR